MTPRLVRECRKDGMLRLLPGDLVVDVPSTGGPAVSVPLADTAPGILVLVPGKDGPWLGEVVR